MEDTHDVSRGGRRQLGIAAAIFHSDTVTSSQGSVPWFLQVPTTDASLDQPSLYLLFSSGDEMCSHRHSPKRSPSPRTPSRSFPDLSASLCRHPHDSLSLADTKEKTKGTGEMLIGPGGAGGWISLREDKAEAGGPRRTREGPEAPPSLSWSPSKVTFLGDPSYISAR